jgi:hypothetical protein
MAQGPTNQSALTQLTLFASLGLTRTGHLILGPICLTLSTHRYITTGADQEGLFRPKKVALQSSSFNVLKAFRQLREFNGCIGKSLGAHDIPKRLPYDYCPMWDNDLSPV